MGLTDRQCAILEFERTWWTLGEEKELLIRRRFACGPDAYYDELNEVLHDPDSFAEIQAYLKAVSPELADRVKHYKGKSPIFDAFGIESQIEKTFERKVWLKKGGYICIDHAEALVAIDVNTGRYVGKKSAGRLEDTIVKTNLEAAKEIIRQIRLRDLGGIIVLDFIDMEEKKNRQKVFQAIEQELRRDRAPSKAVQVSDFGLIIITRKRVKSSLERDRKSTRLNSSYRT